MSNTKYIDDAELISRGHRGYTVNLKGGGMVTGYQLSDEDLDAYIDAGVPAIDKLSMDEELASSLSMSMPMCNSDQLDLPPFSGMSYTTPDVLADLWSRAGARVYNVSGYAFGKELFRTFSNKEAAVLMGWTSNSEEKVTEAVMMDEKRDGLSEALQVEVSPRFQKAIDLVMIKLREAEAEDIKIKEERKGVNFTEWRDRYPNYEDQEPQARVASYSKLLPRLIYEGYLAQTGQKEESVALHEAASYLKDNHKASLSRLDPKNHSVSIEALKKVGKTLKAIENAAMGFEPGLKK